MITTKKLLNNINNNKCNIHPTKEILSICSNCNNEPICIKCITSSKHCGHQFSDLEDDSVISPIIDEFCLKTIPNLESREFIKENEINQEKLDNNFKSIGSTLQSNLDLITNKFTELDNIRARIENDLKRQLITALDENIEINITNKLTLTNEIDTVSKMIKFNQENNENIINNKNNNNNNNNYLKQTIKDYYLSRSILNKKIEELGYNDYKILGKINKDKQDFNLIFEKSILELKTPCSEDIDFPIYKDDANLSNSNQQFK
ncbi:hypothetical protein ACTFIU_003530 [Dictyostelium citrinum]